MIKKLIGLFFSFILLVNMCGCIAILAGAAASTGTAAWLSGKLSQEVNASFEGSLKATKSALSSLKLNVTKETVKEGVAQVMSNYTDGKTIWIDINRVSKVTSRIEVRVGVAGDQEAAHKILDRIRRYL
jgi:hypothetical protein